ncbi:hypothetical protein WN55_05537 [Dufourea novaeangliae]|uniref:Uncharacterized protein n=1 Tax=Dufourea novaeangliae TaxID=178035 RepID=A0A154PNS7_DUFNO|nr:hypothetical protein WN55_05537 [Dufourea novaeangliae]
MHKQSLIASKADTRKRFLSIVLDQFRSRRLFLSVAQIFIVIATSRLMQRDRVKRRLKAYELISYGKAGDR